jgi:hypothetical protein
MHSRDESQLIFFCVFSKFEVIFKQRKTIHGVVQGTCTTLLSPVLPAFSIPLDRPVRQKFMMPPGLYLTLMLPEWPLLGLPLPPLGLLLLLSPPSP